MTDPRMALWYRYMTAYDPLLGLLAPLFGKGEVRRVPEGVLFPVYLPGEQHRELTFWLGGEALDG